MKNAVLLSTCTFLTFTASALADVKVMASIKPVQSLVASVMQGIGEPGLIVGGKSSPHTYVLKPEDAAALQKSNVIFWIGPDLEAFLEKPIVSLGANAVVVSLMETPGVKTLAVREGNGFDKHEHEGENHEDTEELDAHIWLDPENAKAMVNNIADVLSKQDPEHAKTYADNAAKTVADLDDLTTDIKAQMAPLKGKGFIVFHDAYHYFESRFGLQATGAISLHPESAPGAKSIVEIKHRIADGKVICVFAEPQFDNALITTVTEGTNVKSATLDPEGAALDPGPGLYAELLRNISKSLSGCLS